MNLSDAFLTFKVELTNRYQQIKPELTTPNYTTTGVRSVDIPLKKLQEKTDKISVLELIFELGQNDFQPKPVRSVSVGDVVNFFGEKWAVNNVGWVKVEEKA